MKHLKENKNIRLTLLVILIGAFSFLSLAHEDRLGAVDQYNEDRIRIKEEALVILKSKCNYCHVKQNPFKVFTMKNMDRLALKIEEQVFVLKRMPKSESVKLSSQELETIKKWIDSTKI